MQIKDYERSAYYYETDQMAIIHHSNYIRWFEESRIDYMAQMGFSYERMEKEGIIIPVIEVQCKYISMVRFGDTVVIHPWISKYTGTRLDVSYEVRDKKTGELRTTGYSKHCFLNKEGRVCSLKKTLPEAHEAFLASLEKTVDNSDLK